MVSGSSSRNNLPKNLRTPLHSKLSPMPVNKSEPQKPIKHNESVWSPDELEAITALFKRKMPQKQPKFLNSASRNVLEAMAKGFVKAGNLSRARKILLIARKNKRTLDSSVYVKLILEAGKNPDGYKLCLALLDELSEREELDLKPQECTSIMKICVKLGTFEVVESLFDWYRSQVKK